MKGGVGVILSYKDFNMQVQLFLPFFLGGIGRGGGRDRFEVDIRNVNISIHLKIILYK